MIQLLLTQALRAAPPTGALRPSAFLYGPPGAIAGVFAPKADRTSGWEDPESDPVGDIVAHMDALEARAGDPPSVTGVREPIVGVPAPDHIVIDDLPADRASGKHRWRDHPTLGKVCANCSVPKATVGTKPCPAGANK